MLNSSIAFNKPANIVGLGSLLQPSEEDRVRMEKAGCQPVVIGRIESEDDGSYS